MKLRGDEEKAVPSVMSAYSQQESQLLCICSVGVWGFGEGGVVGGGFILMYIVEKQYIAQCSIGLLVVQE